MNENQRNRKAGDFRCSGSICENLHCCWKIDKFSSLSDTMYLSPPISSVDENKVKWNLILWPAMIDTTNNDGDPLVTCSIFCANYLDVSINSKVSCSFVNSENELIAGNDDRGWTVVVPGDATPAWRNLEIKKNFLLSKLKNDIVIINLEIIYTRSVVKIGETTRILSDICPYATLADDFCKLSSLVKPDVAIVVGDEEIPVHRTVLSARSAVFAAMFRHDTVENRTGRVEIGDFNVGLVMHMVDFMYKGTLEVLDVPLALDLLKIGDKYCVDSLMSNCTTFLTAQLDKSNLVRVLEVVDYLTTCIELRAKVVEFICENVSADDLRSNLSGLRETPAVIVDVILLMKKRRSMMP